MTPAAGENDLFGEVWQAAASAKAAGQDWMKLLAGVYAAGGIVERLYTLPEERRKFYGGAADMAARAAVAELRRSQENAAAENQKVITVRMPARLHAALQREAGARGMSINQLCLIGLVSVLHGGASPVR